MTEPVKLKQGFVRSDGRVFYQYLKGKEIWITAEQFQRYVGDARAASLSRRLEKREAKAADAAIRRAAYQAQLAEWAASKEERAAIRKERDRVRMLEKRAKDPAAARESDRIYREKNKSDAKYLERRARANRKYAEKVKLQTAPRIAERHRLREEKKQALEAKRKAWQERIEASRAAREAKVVVPRVLLTEDQKRDRRRDEKRNYKHRRRAIIRNQEAKATPSEIRDAKKKAKGVCFYCRKRVRMLTLDHVIPIAKGGCHTLDNIVFACHACNSEKRDLDPEVYAEKHGLLLI